MTFGVTSTGGSIVVSASGPELEVLRAVHDVVDSIGSQPDDPALERLFPPAYGSVEEDREFHRLSGGEITASRRADATVIEQVVAGLGDGPVELSFEQAEGLARAVATARLVVAARNGMFDEDELPSKPTTLQHTIVAFLGAVQDELVHELSASLPR